MRPSLAGLGSPENCKFSGLHEVVPKEEVLRIGDGRMQAENGGFRAWYTNDRPICLADYTGPHALRCAPVSLAQTGLLVFVFLIKYTVDLINSFCIV